MILQPELRSILHSASHNITLGITGNITPSTRQRSSPSPSVQLLAEEATEVAQLDLQASRELLSQSQAAITSAGSEQAKVEAMIAVEVAEELVKAAEV